MTCALLAPRGDALFGFATVATVPAGTTAEPATGDADAGVWCAAAPGAVEDAQRSGVCSSSSSSATDGVRLERSSCGKEVDEEDGDDEEENEER